MDLDNFDVLVAGGGNAALCAALCAVEQGATVLVLEAAPRHMRGGNTRHTRNLRAMHEAPTEVLTEAYPEEEYLADLMRVTAGETKPELARLTIRESAKCPAWMIGYGVRFQPSLTGTLHLGRTNAFFLGGGKGALNELYAAAEARGVAVRYDTEVVAIELEGNRFKSATATIDGRPTKIRAKAFVAAAGGFESNLEWLKEAWGPPAENFLIRGTPHNTGKVLKSLLAQGVKPIGDPKQCHAVAIDARAPKFDGGIVTRLDSVSLGVVVNQEGKRFYDEGEDFWPKRYAIWGRLVAAQPGQIGFSIVDAKAIGKFMPSVFPPVRADSIRGLAEKLGVPPEACERTIAEFNRAIRPGRFDHSILDDCRTEGLSPDKTHWARPIDTPPFLGFPLRPGITFTYLSTEVNEHAAMLMADGRVSPNLFAAGEMMAGNVLGRGYLAGIGMTIGTVFGRIAGTSAGKYVKSLK